MINEACIGYDVHRLAVICADLIHAYADPKCRPFVQRDRQAILQAVTDLTDVLMAEDRARIRQLSKLKRDGRRVMEAIL